VIVVVDDAVFVVITGQNCRQFERTAFASLAKVFNPHVVVTVVNRPWRHVVRHDIAGDPVSLPPNDIVGPVHDSVTAVVAWRTWDGNDRLKLEGADVDASTAGVVSVVLTNVRQAALIVWKRIRGHRIAIWIIRIEIWIAGINCQTAF
jgi:hypothetical protein